jgi:hypothetical protein
VSRSAQPVPFTDVLSGLGVLLTQAVVRVLKQQIDPLSVAHEATIIGDTFALLFNLSRFVREASLANPQGP